ncbi:redoxin domain-containing protein [Fimbriimonas ginsengisoli]|uniref:redoxin domain-containing protein n=1 Tax=Fimbriimonas ginsengisoli TaxID=1005039 RepID=UPI00130E22C2|nr:redoxin domain-containing protein [Fimbriimonas ginsengisoli]
MKLGLSFVALALAAVGCAQDPHTPEVVGTKWLNLNGQKPITLTSRAGKVTVVHFWTFACSNCKANLPIYDFLYEKFAKRGVEMVGIHTPELAFEKVDENVRLEVKKLGIKYPVLIDTDGRNWNRWKQEFWPTIYVIDKKGRIAFKWAGELNYQGADGERQTIAAIEKALRG